MKPVNSSARQPTSNSSPQGRPQAGRAWCASIIVSLALITAAANQSLAQAPPIQNSPPEGVRAQVRALLGSYEGASPEQWRRLGNSAVPILESVASDSNALPTRRARSLDGLAALGSGNITMQRVASSGGEPLVVRMAAVRGLGQVLPEAALTDALRPMLQDPNPQLRGVAAETLSHSPAGCSEVQNMMAKESESWRSRFASRCDAQASSAAPSTAGASTTGADPSARVVAYRIVDPTGTTIYDYASPANPEGAQPVAKIQPSLGAGAFSVLLPNSPTVPFASGAWIYNLLASKPTTVDVQAIIKTSSTSSLTAGRFNANLFFVGVPGLNARSAQTDPNFQAILAKTSSIYAQIGVQLGDLTYIDVTGPNVARYTDLVESDLGSLMRLSTSPEARDGAINLFFVHSIVSGQALSGFIILGESAGIPGNPVRGSPLSGVAITMADFPRGLDEVALTMAHETGHWLGLFHPTGFNGLFFDPLPDTPECPQVPYDTNHDGIMEPEECVGHGADNLMFWTDSFPLHVLTPNQQYAVMRNPLVSRRTNGGFGGDVHTVRLGTVAVASNELINPITVNVPADAVSVDLIGDVPTPPPPPAIRVPEDFPTIQLAVNSANGGDTIRVGPGRWCGARITTPVNLVGKEGATIIGCPAGNPGPVGITYRRGFRIEAAASGTSVSHFVFDGNGLSDSNLLPLSVGIEAAQGSNDLVIDANTFQGGAFGIELFGGNGQYVTHNRFDGFTVLSNGIGGAAILDIVFTNAQATDNYFLHNRITATVPSGNYAALSWINEVDVPLAGIVVSGQDRAVISSNKISIAANTNGDSGVGILATDSLTNLTTTNLTILNNDGRKSAYSLIVTNDSSGGTGNTVGATIRGNLGVNLINGSISYVDD